MNQVTPKDVRATRMHSTSKSPKNFGFTRRRLEGISYPFVLR